MIWQNVFYNNIATYISLINEELKEKFPLEPLSNHIKVLGGYAFKSADYRDTGIPVIRISDFQDERIDLSGVRYFREDKAFDKFQLFGGDIIIAMTGGTIGKLAIVQDGLGKLYLNQRVGKFQVLNKEEFVPEYVYWLARGIQDKVKNLGYGGAQPNVSNGQIEALKFAFPDKKVQLKIIEFLNDLKADELKPKTYFNASVEDRILQFQNLGVNVFSVLEECNKQQTYLQLLRQIILQEAIQGKLTKQDPTDQTATALLKRIKAEKEKLMKVGKLKKEKELPPITEDEIPFDLPEGWVWCRLGETTTNVDYGTSEKANLTGDVPVLRMGNVQEAKIVLSNLKFVRKTIADLPRLYLKKDDLIFNRTNSFELVGKCGIFEGEDDEYTLASYLIRVSVLKELVSINFINSYINSTICRTTQIEPQITQQTGQANFSGSKLKNILFPLPPFAEQQRIVAKVQQLQQQLSQLEAQVQQSRRYAQQLLQSVLKEAFEQKGKEIEEEVSMVAEGEIN